MPHATRLVCILNLENLQIQARWWTEKSFFIPIRFLSNFCMKDDDSCVPAIPEVILHGLPGESLVLGYVVHGRPEYRICDSL